MEKDLGMARQKGTQNTKREDVKVKVNMQSPIAASSLPLYPPPFLVCLVFSLGSHGW